LRFGVQGEAIGRWHRREVVVVEVLAQARHGRHLPPFDSVGISDPFQGFLARAVQENGQQLSAVPLHDRLECSELGAVVRLRVAEGHGHERNAVGGRGFQRGVPDRVHEFPETGHAEIEDRPCQINHCVIVEQPAWDLAQQSFGDRQFAGGRGAMK
jgi:hypothetical protein